MAVEMSQSYEELTGEIGRIVNSPYPTQLKHLRDILSSKCTTVDVCHWAQAMPCQIDRLAECVLEGLQHWPYVLEIVERLSFSLDFRDACLRYEPSLLHGIVLQAAKAPDTQTRYTKAAVAMLSRPLPTSAAIPSDVQSLFIRMFDYAAQQPTVESVKPVYRVLQGTSNLLLGLLPSNALLQFEAHVFDILRNIKGDNQSLSLYCLAILKILSSTSDDHGAFSTSSYDTQELLASTHVTSSRWTPDAVRQFFTESKAQKTLQLIVLRAMWACTATTGEQYEERMESLLLANEVISAVPKHLRETWRKANALVVRKLEEKVLAPALDPNLHSHALCFLVRLTEDYMRPATITDRLRHIVTKLDMMKLVLCDNEKSDLNCIMRSGVFDQSTTTSVLQSLVDFVSSARAKDVIEHSGHLRQILHTLTAAMAEEDSIVHGTLLALDVLSCGRKLESLGLLVRGSYDGNSFHTGICQQALRAMQNRLVHEICKVFLTAVLSARDSTYSVAQQTTLSLLELHALSAQLPPPCDHIRHRQTAAHDAFQFIEADSTQQDQKVDWRKAVQLHFQSRARHEQEVLTGVFTKACSDLESRCDNIERPLLEEQEKRSALQKQYDDLSQAYACLETEGIEQNIRFNALEMERDQCISDLESIREEADGLMQQVADQERNLRKAEIELEKTITKSKKVREAAELEHATALAKKQEDFEKLDEQLQQTASAMTIRAEEFEKLKKNMTNAKAKCGAANMELEQLKVIQTEQQTEIGRLKAMQDDQVTRETELQTEIRTSKDELDAAHRQNERQICDLEQAARQNLASLNAGNEERLAELRASHEEAKQNLNTQLEELRETSRRTEATHMAQLDQKASDIAEKQKKIDRLIRKCDHKDKQIAEANAMRTNLMAAMGIVNGVQQQTQLPHHPSRASTQRPEMESQTDPSPPTPLSGDQVETQREAGTSFASIGSSGDSRGGPTPKRPRTRKALKVASPARPRLSASVNSRLLLTSVGGQSSVKRQPLLSITANHFPMNSAAPKTPCKSLSKDMPDNLDDSTFDGSELFAGTPEDAMLDFGRGLDENLENRF